jgi:putative ABC transport system substrate-binding protein
VLRRLILGAAILITSGAGWFFLQADARPVRIGLLLFTASNERIVEGFKKNLAEHGFREGKNVEYRSLQVDGKIEKLEASITELISWQPNLILSVSTPPSQAAYRATKASRTPLIFANVSDPQNAGIVSNLTHPGEHATGVRLAPSTAVRLQWLLRVAPHVRSIYVPYSSNDKSATESVRQIEEAAKTLGVQVTLKHMDSLQEIEQISREIPVTADAIFLSADNRIAARIDLFVAVARQRRLPLSAPSALQVENGALTSFGFDHLSIGRQAGRLALEIINGRLPGDLPVETAESALYINQTTAQSIGLKIDDAVLRQARKIIH